MSVSRFLFAAAALFTHALATAQSPENDPIVASLIERHAENYGSLREDSKLVSMQAEGTVEKGGSTYSFELHRKAPDYFRYRLRKGGNTVTSGYDGNRGWQRIARGGEVTVRELPPDAVAFLRREASFRSPLLDVLESDTTTAKVLDPENSPQGERLRGLRVEAPNTPSVRYYLEPTTGHLRMRERLSPDGTVTLTTRYRDYREVDGFPFAFEIENRVNGEQVSLTRIEKIRVNSGLLSFLFEMPRD